MAFFWESPDNYATLLSTGLNSLAAGQTVLSSVITPSGSPGRHFYRDFGLLLASHSPGSNQSFLFYLLRALDDAGTVFPGIESAVAERLVPCGSGTSVTRELQIPHVLIPSRPYKVGLKAGASNVTIASSGNTLVGSTFTET